ncbi:MAG: hypothetical protein LBT74_14095 [Acidobacteriota bacterium]|jgi:hypothetical protein|nr:hypothetical protein [Acidobacteriota bacterium]
MDTDKNFDNDAPQSAADVWALFRESDRRHELQMKEIDRRMEEIDRRMEESRQRMEESSKRTDKKISELGSRIGEIIEAMVEGDIVDKFRALGYDFTQCARNVKFENKKLGIRGEIDLFLEDGELAMLVEVKTSLETADVKRHIERLEKYRRYAAAKSDRRRFVAAVAGAVVMEDAQDFALDGGIYVIVQSGEAVRIVPPPEGFKAREW